MQVTRFGQTINFIGSVSQPSTKHYYVVPAEFASRIRTFHAQGLISGWIARSMPNGIVIMWASFLTPKHRAEFEDLLLKAKGIILPDVDSEDGIPAEAVKQITEGAVMWWRETGLGKADCIMLPTDTTIGMLNKLRPWI